MYPDDAEGVTNKPNDREFNVFKSLSENLAVHNVVMLKGLES